MATLTRISACTLLLTHFGAKGEVTLLAEEEIIDQLPRFRELGLDSLIERTYRIGG